MSGKPIRKIVGIILQICYEGQKIQTRPTFLQELHFGAFSKIQVLF